MTTLFSLSVTVKPEAQIAAPLVYTQTSSPFDENSAAIRVPTLPPPVMHIFIMLSLLTPLKESSIGDNCPLPLECQLIRKTPQQSDGLSTPQPNFRCFLSTLDNAKVLLHLCSRNT